MRLHRKRRGVASIVGTVIFVLVFMLALGSLAYVSGFQSQASQAELQAQTLAGLRAGESVTYSTGQQGLGAIDAGADAVTVNHVILRFPNGTVYALAASSTIPPGGQVQVLPLIPTGTCAPGTATCVSKYNSITTGAAPGSSVGVVTSLGNVFWYWGSSTQTAWSKSSFASSGAWSVPSGISSVYVVCIGGGGGGGGTGGATYNGGSDGGGGGGGGGVGSLAQGFVNLAGVSTVSVTVGQGGQGGTAGTEFVNGGQGGSGGTSSFGSYMACQGGAGGTGSPFTINSASGADCYVSTTPGGAGAGILGGTSISTGVPSSALQQTIYGGGGGGGGSIYNPAGAGSPSNALSSGTIYAGLPGTSGNCAFGGGGGSASPFANGGTGGSGATTCASGKPGTAAQANSGAGGGGGGGSYSTSSACGYKPGAAGGGGGSGLVEVFYGS